MAGHLRQLRLDYGPCWAFGACGGGEGEVWTALRRDATPGCRPADWIVTATWQQMIWLVRQEHAAHPVPFARRLEHRDDLLERLCARRPGWAVIRLPDDCLLGRLGDVEAGPWPGRVMGAQMGQALAEAARAASVRPCYKPA
jgi:hypothetical protein